MRPTILNWDQLRTLDSYVKKEILRLIVFLPLPVCL